MSHPFNFDPSRFSAFSAFLANQNGMPVPPNVPFPFPPHQNGIPHPPHPNGIPHPQYPIDFQALQKALDSSIQAAEGFVPPPQPQADGVMQVDHDGNADLDNEDDDALMNDGEGVPQLKSFIKQSINDEKLLVDQLLESRDYEQVKEESQANNIPEDLEYEVDLDLLASVFGDKIIRGSSLASNDHNVIEFFIKILSETFPETGEDKIAGELNEFLGMLTEIEKIKSLSQANKLILDIQVKLNNLPEGGRFLFPGGWNDGKAVNRMIYEIAKINGEYCFQIFDIGHGSDFHMLATFNGKRYQNPLFTVIKIPTENITSSNFWHFVISLAVYNSNEKDHHDKAEDLYTRLTKLLGGEYLTSWGPNPYTGQENTILSGYPLSFMFSSKHITCYLRNRMTLVSYYEFLFAAKFWCLANFIQNKQQPSNYSEAMLLEKAAHGLANLGRKLYFSKMKNNQITKQDVDRLLELSILCEKTLEIAKQFPSIVAKDLSLEPKESVAFKLRKLDSFNSGIDLTFVKENKWKKRKKKGSEEEEDSVEPVTSGGSNATTSIEVVEIDESTSKVEKSSKKEKKKLELTCQTPPFSCAKENNVVKFFQEWKSYLTKAHKTSYPNIAHYHFENMITSFPLDFDLSGLQVAQKKQLFTTLKGLSKAYFSKSKFSERFRMSINMWHLFFMMSTLCQDILKDAIDERINLNEWGVSFTGFQFDRDEKNLRCGVSDLLAQKKYVDLLNYVQNFNIDKKFYHFDTINPNQKSATSFWVTSENVEKCHDLLFFKNCFQALENKEDNPEGSPSEGTSSTRTLLDEILTLYANEQKKENSPIPKIYYDWREMYFLCIFSQQFAAWHLDGKLVYIRHKQESFYDRHLVSFEGSKGSKKTQEIDLDSCTGNIRSLGNLVLPDENIQSFISTIWNQNSIRSYPKSRLLQIGPTSLSSEQYTAISKHEINRMVDIYNSKSEQLSLCLNFYKENPAYLEKNLHLTFLEYIFYLYDNKRFSKEKEGDLKNEIYHFFSNILTVYAFPNNDQKSIVLRLLGMGLKYLEYQPNQELLSLIKMEVLKHYNASQEMGEREIYSQLYLMTLALYQDVTNEEYSNVIMILLELGKQHNTGNNANHVVWKKGTSALLIKLSNKLEEKAARSVILNAVPNVVINLDQSKDTNWRKSELKLTCQGWTFDLCLGTIRHPDVQSLDSILASTLIVKPSDKEKPLSDLLGKTLSPFKLVNGNWYTEDGTVRIIKIKDTYEIQQFINNEWCQFSFYSASLQKSLPGLPSSFVEAIDFSGNKWQETCDDSRHNKGLEIKDGIRWYQPSGVVRSLYWGKDVNNNLLYKLEKKGDQWSLERADHGLVYTTFENSLPSPLIPLKHFPEDTLPTIQFWSNKATLEIERVENHTMSIHKNDNGYVIKGYEDYRLLNQPEYSPFKTLPPFFHLVDDSGKRYFLISYAKFRLHHKNEDDPLISVNLPMSNMYDDEYKRFYLYEYDEKTGSLKGSDVQSRIYLSYLYFIDQNYEEAFKLINSFSQQTPYTPDELDLLKNFLSYLDNNELIIRNPMQLAIMAKIAFFGIRSENFTINKSNILINEDIMIDYILCMNSIPKRYQLSKSEMVVVLRRFDHWLINQFKEHYFDGKDQVVGVSSTKILQWEPRGHDLFPLLKCPIQVEQLVDFDYQKALKHCKDNLKLNCLNVKSGKHFDEKMAMALWMALFSDKVEERMLSSGLIRFLRPARSKQGDKEILASFLLAAVDLTVNFRYYLQQTYQAFNFKNPQHFLTVWPKYHEWLVTNYDLHTNEAIANFLSTQVKLFGHSLPTGQYRTHGAISSAPMRDRTERSLALFNEDISKKDKGMLEERKSIQTKYLAFDTKPLTFHFLPTYGGTLAEQLLNKLPIAKQLYNLLREEMTVNHVKWSLVDKDRGKLAGNLKGLVKEVQDKKKGIVQEAAALKNAIEKEVNSTAVEEGETLDIHHLKMALERKTDQFSYQKKKFTVRDLAELILGNQWESLLKQNPILSPADLEILLNKMINLMVIESEIGIYEAAENELKSLIQGLEKDAHMDVTTEIYQIGTILTTSRYTLDKDPLFLAFEFLTKLTLRQTQVDKLNQYLTSENTHQVMKLMMGDGKTKVILPFLSKVIADGDQFPIIIAPHSFYEVYLKDMREMCEYSLSQRVFTFQFNRNSSTHPYDTKVILKLIKQTIKERGILLVTAETMKAVLLKYQELLVKEQKTRESVGETTAYSDILGRRQILAEILNLIRYKGTALLDEGHLALNSLTETNFTLMDNETVTEREIRTLSRIFQTLIDMNHDFTIPISIDVSKSESDNLAKIREPLIEKLYPGDAHKKIREYLKGNDPDTIKQLEEKTPDLAAEIKLVKEQIWKYLPFTLSKALNHRYGRHLLNPDIEYAVPYIGAQKPSPLAEFGNKWVALDNTYLMIIQEGVPLNGFEEWLKNLKKQWVRKMGAGTQQEADALVHQYLPHVSFKDVRLDTLSVIKQLHGQFGKNPKVFFDYLETVLLPKMFFPIHKLNSNEQDIGDFVFAKVLALSGTPYNELTYPALFQKKNADEVENDSDEEDSDGSLSDKEVPKKDFTEELFKEDVISTNLSDDDRRLLSTLIRGENERVIPCQKESSEAALEAIEEISHDQSKGICCAYIDLGAYFKDLSNREAAKLIVGRMPKQIQGIVFFDDETNKQMLMHRESGKIEPYKPGILSLNKIGAYFDNVHTYAADIKLQGKAHAIVSLNQEVCLNQVLQAVKRMRQLEQSQTISFLVSEQIIKKLKTLTGSSEIDTSAIYMLSIFNEALSVEKQYVQSTFHALKHCMKKKYLNRQLKTATTLNIANDILVEKNDFGVSGQFSKKMAPYVLFNRFANSILEKVAARQDKLIQSKDFKSMMKRASKLLPKEIETDNIDELSREIEKQEEKKINTLTENNQIIEPYTEESWEVHYLRSPQLAINDINSTWTSPANSQLFCYRLNDFIDSLEGNFDSSLFDPNILVSRNFARTAHYAELDWSTPVKPVDYFVVISQPRMKNYHFLMVTQVEMEILRVQIKFEEEKPQKLEGSGGSGSHGKKELKNPNTPLVALMSIQGKLIAGTLPPDKRSYEDVLQRALVQMRFFDGREEYSKKEEPILREWMSEKETIFASLFSKWYKNREKKDDYGNGTLFKLINEAADIHRQQVAAQLLNSNAMMVDSSSSISSSSSSLSSSSSSGDKRTPAIDLTLNRDYAPPYKKKKTLDKKH